jgi:adenine-specific DNA methylase
LKSLATKDLLKSYSGWGGLREAVYTPSVYKEMKKILTQDEITTLKQTLTNAYYTPPDIVKFMYDWLSAYGFTGGDILEPAIGQGVFIEHMPRAIKDNSRIIGVELDHLTSQMVKTLYPDITLHNCGFEQYQPHEKFDLIIGNPPYGSAHIIDSQHLDLKECRIHHYFVAKSMRLLKEGGILAMVLPSFFMDNMKGHVRDVIYREGGDLLSAYRLPDDLFSDAKVTVDVVFLIKRRTGKRWVDAKDICIGGIKKPMNEFFHQYSNRILGNLEIIDMYGRKGLSCKKRGDTSQLLHDAINNLKHQRLAKISQELASINQKMQDLQTLKQGLANTYQQMIAPC